jgi:thymidylate synthase (FAD)
MKIVESSYEILTDISPEAVKQMMRNIERIGRTCYKSEDKIAKDSYKTFVNMIVSKNHLAVIEHEKLSVRFITDRGISHEMVRHRLASFAQESTRYCNYSNDKFGHELVFVCPFTENEIAENTEGYCLWLKSMQEAEDSYMNLLSVGVKAQMARSVLPNSTKTEVVVTTNLRHWLEIFSQRDSSAAHPQMRRLMHKLHLELQEAMPLIFRG